MNRITVEAAGTDVTLYPPDPPGGDRMRVDVYGALTFEHALSAASAAVTRFRIDGEWEPRVPVSQIEETVTLYLRLDVSDTP